MKLRYLTVFGVLLVAAFLVVACSDDDDDGDATGATGGTGAATGATGGGEASLDGVSITVGSKEFTEQLILGQIAILALENAGADVEDKTNIFSTDNVRTALDSGEIDMYWEYTGTGWSTILGREISEAPEDPAALYEEVAQADLDENSIVWMDMSPLNNTYALMTTASRSQELGITTISQYAELANSDPGAASLCGATEWLTRDDGLPGLEAAYSFDLPTNNVAEIELSIIPSQVVPGDTCQFGEAFATDGSIAANDLVVLEDDQGYFVPYNLAMTVRQEVYDENSEAIDAVLNPISQALTDDVMQELNSAVEVDAEEPRDVAEEFLRDNGFIS